MKIGTIIQAAIIFAIMALAASCSPGREYRSYPPRTSASFSLIVNPGPGIVASRYYDGRYYYRDPRGYMYWRGYNNRYYLDRSYLGRVNYDRRQYGEWHRYYGRRR